MAEVVPGLLVGRRGVVVGVGDVTSIGYACMIRLRELGAQVVGTARVARLGSDTVTDLVEMDIRDEASIAAAVANIERELGRLDFVVHTVMHVPDGVLRRPLLALQRDEFDAALGTSVYGLVAVLRHAVTLLERSDGPRVVTLMSACGSRMTPHYHVAGIAKGALASAMLYLAHELGERGILVNAVSPGLVATTGAVQAVGKQVAEATRAYQARKAPTRRAVEPGEIADCVAFLVSPMARNLTGETIIVDGGFSHLYL